MINTILMTILLGSLAVLAAIVGAEHDYHGNGVRAGIAMLCGWFFVGLLMYVVIQSW